jgi:hypothetical protein
MTGIPLGYLLRDPAERARLAERIRSAVASSGSLQGAANALGLTYRTLCRWREKWPDLVPDGEPGNPNLKKLRANHDTRVMAKRRKNGGSPQTRT